MCFVLWNLKNPLYAVLWHLKISFRLVICRGRVALGQKPDKNPKIAPGERSPGGLFLSGQQFSVREPVERRANVRGIVELPTAYERIRERFHCVAVVTLQFIN